MSTKKTIEYLVCEQKKKEAVHKDSKESKTSTKKLKKERPPPLIPPSPPLTADDTLQTDFFLRKFELDAANQTWQQNVCSKPEFKNPSFITSTLDKFGLNVNKYQYQSLIKHRNMSKSRIAELIEDGQSIHIVTQNTDIGCPTITNPNTKKGCWCIEEVKKQKKSHIHKLQSQHNQYAHHNLTHLQNFHRFAQHNQHSQLLKQQLINRSGTTQHTHAHTQQLSNPLLFAANSNALNHQQKALNQLNLMYLKNINMNTTAYHHRMHPTNPLLQNVNGMSTTAASSVGMIQNDLISNARTQHYTPSNRMQQIRMQQLLLNARQNNPCNVNSNASTTTTTTTTTTATTTTNNHKNHSINTIGKTKANVLGVRQHKDTIIFTNNKTNGEPAAKRRKKSRWGK